MSNEQTLSFLRRTLEMGEKWRKENAPTCSNCEEKTEYSEATFDQESEEFLVFWSCSCGNVETERWVRPSNQTMRDKRCM